METVELIAVGDISLTSSDGRDPFTGMARHLRAGDVVFGNLECVLCEEGAAAEKEVTLRASPEYAKHLKQAGFSVLSLANNHILDFGSTGLSQTLAALREQGIASIGAGDRSSVNGEAIVESRGLKLGFLAYGQADVCHVEDGVFVSCIHRCAILDQLRCLKARCDLVVVSLHWGIEYARYPSPDQTKLAREIVAEGAALVLGHHPHVIQGVEQIGTAVIAYSLGSFRFKPVKEEGTRQSFILHARLSARGVERYRLVPIWVDEDFLPGLARGEQRRETSRFVRQISAPIREDRITEKWWFEQVAPIYLYGHWDAWMRRIRKYGPRHFVQFMRWLVSGFTIKCCLGLLRRRVGFHE